MYISSISSGRDSLKINYLVRDPLSEYGVIKLHVTEDGSNKTWDFDLDPDRTSYTVLGLKSHTKYLCQLYYYDEDGEKKVADYQNATTGDFDISMSIDRVTAESINCTIRFDSSYRLGEPSFQVFDGDKEISSGEPDIRMDVSYNGIITATIPVDLQGEFGEIGGKATVVATFDLGDDEITVKNSVHVNAFDKSVSTGGSSTVGYVDSNQSSSGTTKNTETPTTAPETEATEPETESTEPETTVPQNVSTDAAEEGLEAAIILPEEKHPIIIRDTDTKAETEKRSRSTADEKAEVSEETSDEEKEVTGQ